MKKILIFIFCSLAFSSHAKSLQSFGAMGFINITKTLSPRYDLTFYHYDIFSFHDQNFQGKSYHSGDIQTYFQTVLTYRYLPHLHFALGYIFSRNDPFLEDSFQNENRLFQQVVYSQNFETFRLSHRVRLEERFIDNRSEDLLEFRTRLRYQIGMKTTLLPATSSRPEFYSNSYNELYFSTTGKRNAFFSDDWLYSGIGMATKEWGSFELGPMLQYSVVNTEKDQRFFYVISLGWLIKF
jgi:hypothetical protein